MQGPLQELTAGYKQRLLAPYLLRTELGSARSLGLVGAGVWSRASERNALPPGDLNSDKESELLPHKVRLSAEDARREEQGDALS